MVTRCRRFTDKQGVYLTRELDAQLQKFLPRDTRHTHARRWRRLLLLQLRAYASTGDWAIRRADRPASGGLARTLWNGVRHFIGQNQPHAEIFWPNISYSLCYFYGARMTITRVVYKM